MHDKIAQQSQPEPRKRTVIYHVALTSFWARLFGFFLAAAILVAALFISFMVVWVILSIVLIMVIYTLFASRRRTSGKSENIDGDPTEE